ncbi:MAG TPA: signal peptidase II [Thermoanaerobaculia bacterium]
MKSNRLALALIILVVVGVDQWTKALARTHLSPFPRTYAGGVVSLLHTENEGAFLSLGSTLPPTTRTLIFTGAVAIAVLLALGMLVFNRVHGYDAVAVALIAAGGIGNLIDRLFRDGRVTDFLYLAAGPLHTGVFNVADMAITLAVVWLLLSSFAPAPKPAA